MPKMRIAVDSTTRDLLRKYGGHHPIGTLVGRRMPLDDQEATYGWHGVRQTLNRMEEHLCPIQDENKGNL